MLLDKIIKPRKGRACVQIWTQAENYLSNKHRMEGRLSLN